MLYGKLTPRQKLTKARVYLNKQKPFFGHLTMRLQFKEEKNLPSMGVDKYGTCYWNKDFVDKLSQEEVNGVLCHEVMHCALGHLEDSTGKDKQLLNISQDAVINGLLKIDGMKLPSGGIIPNYAGNLEIFDTKIKQVHKKSHHEVYDKLYNKWKKLPKKKQEYSNGFDKHIRKPKDNEKDKGKGKGKKNNSALSGSSSGNGDKKNIDWKKELVEASTFAKMRGNLPAGVERLVDELLGNKIDWRGLLYKYITNTLPYDYTWSRPNKKSHSTGVYMPNVLREKIDIVCSIDTSGSISDKDLQTFSSELLGIVNSFENVELTIIYNDTEVYGPHKLRNPTPEDIKDLKPEGFGGTNHIPVFDWVNKNNSHAKLLICFTDGYTSFPKSSYVDTIWVLSGYHINKDEVPFGQVIEMPKE